MDMNALSLEYHSQPTPGKVSVVPTKPCQTQLDLSLAYTPGVATPCLEIEKKPDDCFIYTARANLVAVISNGTAVLGLGDIGALAGKPVMEGKGVLFKRFAGVDVFDLEVDTHDPDELINICAKLAPTFGGINLEDIKAPECFEIERRLQEMVDIPVFHDDQHGTAIITGAGMINGCLMAGKKLEDIKIVVSGAGAAGIACTKFYISLGARPENIVMVDSKGVIYKGRKEGMNPYKAEFAIETKDRTLADAMRGADCFSGLSRGGIVTQDMVKSMADHPIIFAMANPTPEIMPDEARAARADAIIATGRSDYPNQINNVLGFPFIFRGALDVHARKVNEEMKRAACHALAELARQDVPDSVLRAYGLKQLKFGRDYIIPKPFDPRVLIWEASAVAEAAVKSGVARVEMTDFDAYREQLSASISRSRQFMRPIRGRARGSDKRIAFADGEHPMIIRAVNQLRQEKVANPVLVGREDVIKQRAVELGVDLAEAEICDPHTHGKREELTRHYYEKHQRRGINWADAQASLRDPDCFAATMLDMGLVDGLVCGLARAGAAVLESVKQVIPLRPDMSRVCGVYLLLTKNHVLLLADCGPEADPTAEQLAEAALLAAKVAQHFCLAPKVALVSDSNFGSRERPENTRVREALAIVKERQPDLCIDGEMQVSTALSKRLQDELFPFCELGGPANVLVFPNPLSGLTAGQLMVELGGAEGIGPLACGFSKPVSNLSLTCDVEEVIDATALTVVQCLDGVL